MNIALPVTERRWVYSFTFTPTVANPVLAWAGHISTRKDWGANNSAVAISGSPYHTRLIDLDGAGGYQDRSLSADAVIFPGSITIIKDATPNGTTSFGFTASPAPLANFSLVDDGTIANTKVFNNITSFTSYTVNETPIPANWGYDSVSCSVTSPNGGSYATSTTTVTINMDEGENWTCTYLDSIRVGTLTVIKHVVNDNGGTAPASDWSLHVKSGSTEVTGSPQAGSESGTSYTLNGGTYLISESGGPSGYTFTGFSGDCDSSGSVTVVAGQNMTCTLTNDDNTAHLTLVKIVTNDNGGSAAPTAWTLSASGPTPISGAGGADSDVNAGSYTLSETTLPGYTAGSWSCSGGTFSSPDMIALALGQSAICSITNDDQQAYVIVNKVVINNNGGAALPDDFKLTLDGSATTSGTKVAVNPGSHTAAETLVAGYSFTGFSGDCNGSGKVTVALGETKTCTLTNDDIQPRLTLVKTVDNKYGGTKQVPDFPLFISGMAATSGTAYGLNAGSYTASETQQTGYTASVWGGDCAADGSVTLVVGDNKTCTITNDDIQPTLTLVKIVVNDNGGAKQVADFPLFISGQPATSGVAVGVNAGAYTASETSQYGYTASAWGGDCAANGSVTLSVGDNKTCTITNNDQPGTIIVKKIIKPTGALTSFAFNTTGAGYNGFSLSDGQTNTQVLSAGAYTVKELVPLGWVLTGIGGSTDPLTPYNCTITGSGGSTGLGDLATQTATISLKNGGTVTCVFENTGQGATRTQGFWATHSQLAKIAWFGGSGYGHDFPGVAKTAGIGDTQICGASIDTLGKVMGAFWSDISKTSTGKKRSSLDQAKMQLLQQLIAAELNASAFGSLPTKGTFADWEKAFCGTDAKAIQTAQQQAASFNTLGDSSTFTPGTSADSKYARSIADIAFWDFLPTKP